MADSIVTPYSTAVPFIETFPSWLNAYDARRLASYKLYDDIYHGTPEAFKLMIRGSEDKPIYIPSAKQIINTMSRYTGRGWGFSVDPTFGSESEQIAAITAFGDLFNRERMLPKFSSAKKFGLIRGDWAFLILADPNKPEGRRISIRSLDPSIIFPIWDANDDEHQTGVDLVEQFTTADNKTFLKRQRWIKGTHPDHPAFETPGQWEAPIQYQSEDLELKDWEINPKVAQVRVPPTMLDPRITALPVYRLRNNEEPGNPWGSSELRGMERLIAGINQAISDEDIALAMAGLGLYATNGGAPVNDDNEEVDWDLGPGKVVETGGDREFKRISGVASVEPVMQHLDYLHAQMMRSSGISEVALGQVDVQSAESGIALALRMAPLLDASAEKDLEIEAVMDQMLFDLRSWFDVYEGVNLVNTSVVSAFGEKLPQNREKDFTELLELLNNNLVTKKFALDTLSEKFGYDFPPGMLEELEAASAAMAAMTDPYADRLADPDAEEEEAPAEEEI